MLNVYRTPDGIEPSNLDITFNNERRIIQLDEFFRVDGEWIGHSALTQDDLPNYYLGPTLQDFKVGRPSSDAFLLLEKELDAFIDSKAQERGWDNRITCTMRAGYANPWQQEAIDFAIWMDSCYTAAFAINADVIANIRPVPISEELILEMPELIYT